MDNTGSDSAADFGHVFKTVERELTATPFEEIHVKKCQREPCAVMVVERMFCPPGGTPEPTSDDFQWVYSTEDVDRFGAPERCAADVLAAESAAE